MKGFKIFVSNVLPSLLYLGAILLGIVAALLSAVIEYSFFRDFLTSTNIPGVLSGQAVPLLIVISLEGSKLCLSVHLQRTAAYSGKRFGPIPRLSKILRYSLVAVSIICTFAWTTNLLYTDLVNGTEAHAGDLTLLKQEFETDVSALRSSLDEKVASFLSSYKQLADDAWKAYNEYEVVYTPRLQYERTLKEKLRLKEVAEQAQAKYEDAKKWGPGHVSEQIEEQVVLRTQRYEADCSALVSQAASQHEGANPYLHVLLTAIAKYLFHKPTYSMNTYFITGLAFSVALAFLLEGLISNNLGYVSMDGDDWNTLLKTTDLSSEDQTYLRNWIRFLSPAIVSTLLYLVFCMLFVSAVDIRMLVLAIVLYTCINMAMDFFQRTDDLPSPSNPLPQPSGGRKYVPMITETVVKACTSFVGFLLLGALFGSDFPELTLPAVGMSIGSVGGQLIRLPSVRV